MLKLLIEAAKIAMPTNEYDLRDFYLGACGVREDGTMVHAKNGSMHNTRLNHYQPLPNSHAETRCLLKLGRNGIMYVSRVAKLDYSLRLARPCQNCSYRLKAANVKKVYYTINSNQYGIFFPLEDRDIVKNC
jgi:tRNA(Arg) A34 adenosine deaminase TadA